jgi:hypothetical protein
VISKIGQPLPSSVGSIPMENGIFVLVEHDTESATHDLQTLQYLYVMMMHCLG